MPRTDNEKCVRILSIVRGVEVTPELVHRAAIFLLPDAQILALVTPF
jgi:hypothetical protein